MPANEAVEHVDVLIVGAGLSGVGAGCQLSKLHPGKSVAILEGRAASGGTWDLFRYPGVRSDSDMFTFSYPWRPWPSDTALADGALILDYVRTVAKEYAVDRLIRYGHRVTAASWDSDTARWTVSIARDGEPVTMTAGFLWNCSGYYDYDEGYSPDFPGAEEFAGETIHPQHWPEDLDYAGKRVVVIGSGATAVTLVPAMAGTAEHVTMLQRSPTYVLSMPGRDPLAKVLRRLPDKTAYTIVRWKNILTQIATYELARRRPGVAKKAIRAAAAKSLPDGFRIDEHFKPTYNPWEQRLCLVPDGDLFKVLHDGTASIVTDTIETFTKTGIRLTSGQELDADIIVTATGLNVLPFGGITFEVDGKPIELARTMSYKALMLSGLPNFIYTVGYTNASWTLKADLVADYACRLLSHMDERGLRSVVPSKDPSVGEKPFIDFNSGYVLRAIDTMPKQGDRAPWLLKQNYVTDLRMIRNGDIDDGVLTFG
ncbi:MAG: NAD(P)/FAD-dependent oxidoreductase [Actinomycetota bacterium]|nr:NAD(P)/FAD-dependent oxidoreductase [Actinomycetota bacterium]